MAVVRAARAAAHQAPRYSRLGGQCFRGRCVTASLNRARRLRRDVGVGGRVGRVYTIRAGTYHRVGALEAGGLRRPERRALQIRPIPFYA